MKSKDNSVKVALIISIAILIVGFMIYSLISRTLPNTNTINAQGISEIKAMPDVVAVYLNIETNASDATTAKDENAEISEKVNNALINIGIERTEITTQNYNIYEDIEWTKDGQKSKGWKAVNQLKVELKSDKADMAGEVIDAGVDNGAKVSYINFELSIAEQNKYKTQALELATQDAKIKAGAIASGLGKNLGKVVSVSSSEWNYYPWQLYRAEGAVASSEDAKEAVTEIQPGEQSVTASVSVVYKIS